MSWTGVSPNVVFQYTGALSVVHFSLIATAWILDKASFINLIQNSSYSLPSHKKYTTRGPFGSPLMWGHAAGELLSNMVDKKGQISATTILPIFAFMTFCAFCRW